MYLKESFNFLVAAMISQINHWVISASKVLFHYKTSTLNFSSNFFSKKNQFTINSCDNLTDLALDNLNKNLKSLTLLQALRLEFASCQKLTDTSIQGLSESIAGLSVLESIDLSFLWCKDLTDASLNSLSKALGNRSSLKRVYLNFSS